VVGDADDPPPQPPINSPKIKTHKTAAYFCIESSLRKYIDFIQVR
jgi:hypothetical protein